ncbi:MAG: hypothetical protein R2747_23910 [Pyrinomonadaceae bacterium]
MKKLLTIGFVLASTVFTVLPAQAADNSSVALNGQTLQQRRDRRDRRGDRRDDNYRRSNRRVRTFYQTRLVRRGRRYYRETYRIRIWPNGRRQVSLVSRVRVRNGRYGRYN